jgi:tRNA G10  N-methylase Trm11
MDPLLALVMANQALVCDGALVYDPFVGTGSLLVSASHFGAYTLGGDIDKTLLHGRGQLTSFFSLPFISKLHFVKFRKVDQSEKYVEKIG